MHFKKLLFKNYKLIFNIIIKFNNIIKKYFLLNI